MAQRLAPEPIERDSTSHVDLQPSRIGPAVLPSMGTERTEQVVRSPGGVEHREQVVTDSSGSEHREQAVHDVAGEQRLRLHTITQVVWLIAGFISALIGMRVILKLIAANPDNQFASFIYSAAGLFLSPFYGLTGSPSGAGMVLEIPALIAILVYLGIGWGVIYVLRMFMDRPETRSSSTFDRFRS